MWQAAGGPRAWSDEYHALMVNEWRLQILDWRQTKDGADGKNAPEVPEPPPFIGDVEKKVAKADLRSRQWEAQQKRIAAARRAATTE